MRTLTVERLAELQTLTKQMDARIAGTRQKPISVSWLTPDECRELIRCYRAVLKGGKA